MSSGFKIAAVSLFALAVVCALLAVIFYFAWNIRGIHDTLIGKTAERRVAQLRGESGRWKVDVRRSNGDAADESWDAGTPWRASQVRGALDSEALTDGSMGVVGDDEEIGTTLLGQSDSARSNSASQLDNDDQFITTLLNQYAGNSDTSKGAGRFDIDEQSESTLLGDESGSVSTNDRQKLERKVDEDDQIGTTLLGNNAEPNWDPGQFATADSSPDDDSLTTLLSDRN